MAQTQRRMIYTKLWTSEQFSKLPDRAKLLYIGMITLADDDGRLIANPSYLRGQIFTYDDITIINVQELRDMVEKTGLIEVYRVNESDYIQHPNWLEYQVIRADLYIPSRFPDRNGNVTETIRKSALSKDKLSKDKLSKNNIEEESKAVTLKETYSEFNNVKLSKEEHSKLLERFGEKNTGILIEELGGYIASTNKRYSSHYATLLNWGRRKIQEHTPKPKQRSII